MRLSVGLVFLLALSGVGCGGTSLDNGNTGGAGGDAGRGGSAGFGGGGSSGFGGSGGTAGLGNPCERGLCEDDGNACTTGPFCGSAATFICHFPPVEDAAECAGGAGICLSGKCVGRFPCTERGIRDAIAAGGGPHTFACDGPTTVVTEAEITIDKEVILDGEDNLTIDANAQHRVLRVEYLVVAELRRLTVQGGAAAPQSGGGIDNQGTLTLENSTVSENSADQAGGIRNAGVLYLRNSAVERNTAEVGGGVVGGTLIAIDSAIVDNESTGAWGGGINGGRITLIRSTVSRNAGGGVRVSDGGHVLLRDSAVMSNTGTSGAGILSAGTVTLLNSTVSGNVSVLNGGGIFNQETLHVAGVVVLMNSTVSGNSAGERGGGIHNNGSVQIVNGTISGNSAGIDGGGIYNRINGRLLLFSSTVSGNSAAAGSGIYYYDGAVDGELTLTNSLVDGECAGSPVSSDGGNLESPGDTCAFEQASDQVGVGPLQLALGPLQDNGGPTETHALGEDSVAIDVIPEAECLDAEGAPLTTDQRGEARTPMCDVGALEVQP